MQTLLYVSRRQARLLHDILRLGRAEAREVALDQLGQGFVAGEGWRGRNALLQQHVGELLAAPRAAANEGVQLDPNQRVARALARLVDAGLLEGGGQLGACQRSPYKALTMTARLRLKSAASMCSPRS